MRALGLAIVVATACSSPHAAGTNPDAPARPDAPRTPDAAQSIDANLTAPTDVPAVPCTGSAGDVYAATAQQGAAPGTILACAPDQVLDLASAGSAANVTATSGVSEFTIAYQTRNGEGGDAVSTARVYLPHVPRARPVPLVVTGHGTDGLADSCAPSMGQDSALPLPYAARGFAAIAPDLAGFGNAGTQEYLDNHAQGWQLLDGVRALRAILPAGVTSSQFLLSGYSQGGGAALSARALAPTDGADLGQLLATVVYAPEWPISLDSFKNLDMLDDPTQLTIAYGLSFSSVLVLRDYAWFENHVGAGHGVDAVPAAFQTGFQAAVQSQCLVALGGYIQTQMLHTGDLVDDTFRTGFLACVAAQGPAAGCTGNASAYYNFLLNNQLTMGTGGGPVLIVQGLLDQIMPPANVGSCIRDQLVSSGVDVDTCVYATSTHSDIMDQHPSGVAWAESVYDGLPRAECDTGVSLPACSQ